MLRSGLPRLSHPDMRHAIPSIAFIAQVYRGGKTSRFAHDLGGEGARSTANGASTYGVPLMRDQGYIPTLIFCKTYVIPSGPGTVP